MLYFLENHLVESQSKSPKNLENRVRENHRVSDFLDFRTFSLVAFPMPPVSQKIDFRSQNILDLRFPTSSRVWAVLKHTFRKVGQSVSKMKPEIDILANWRHWNCHSVRWSCPEKIVPRLVFQISSLQVHWGGSVYGSRMVPGVHITWCITESPSAVSSSLRHLARLLVDQSLP